MSPEPSPEPMPDPSMSPEPSPEPMPDPSMSPEPSPEPMPDPSMSPEPSPEPMPDPSMSPEPSPEPMPDPSMSPEPSPSLGPVVTDPAFAILGAEAQFGRVSPSGSIDPMVSEIVAMVDDRGAMYIAPHALIVEVMAADMGWGLCVSATAESWGTTGRLLWRRAGTESWRPVMPANGSGVCLEERGVGDTTLTYDLALLVGWKDPPGEASGIVSVTADPVPGRYPEEAAPG